MLHDKHGETFPESESDEHGEGDGVYYGKFPVTPWRAGRSDVCQNSGQCHNLRCIAPPPSSTPFILRSTAGAGTIIWLQTLRANASGLVAAHAILNNLLRDRQTAFPRAHNTTFRIRKHKRQGCGAYPECTGLFFEKCGAIAPPHSVQQCRCVTFTRTCGNARPLWRRAQGESVEFAHTFLPER